MTWRDDELEVSADALFRARMLHPAEFERALRVVAEVWGLTPEQVTEVLENVVRRHTH